MKKLIAPAIIAAVLGGGYYFGDADANWAHAGPQCLKMAKDNKQLQMCELARRGNFRSDPDPQVERIAA